VRDGGGVFSLEGEGSHGGGADNVGLRFYMFCVVLLLCRFHHIMLRGLGV